MGLSDLRGKRNLVSLCILVLVAASFLAVAACAPVEGESGPRLFRVPLFDSQTGRYRQETVALPSFRNPAGLSGDAATILVDPQMTGGPLGVLEMTEPVGRFTKEGSIWTPADFTTLQATTLYAHMERLTAIDRDLGLEGVLAQSGLGPAKIGLRSRVADSRQSLLVLNNAIYDGRLDSLFIVPFDRAELPISLNAGVIAHEHFHRLFQASVLKAVRLNFGACQLAREPDSWVNDLPPIKGVHSRIDADEAFSAVSHVAPKIFNQVVLRAMNEGLADFWGWSYSMDERFVGRSLGDAEDSVRRLDLAPLPLVTLDGLRATLLNIKSERDRVKVSYRVGTFYSRFLRALTEVLVADGVDRYAAAIEVRRALASSLAPLGQQTAKSVSTSAAQTEIDPQFVVGPIVSALLKSKSAIGRGEKICNRVFELASEVMADSGGCEAFRARFSEGP